MERHIKNERLKIHASKRYETIGYAENSKSQASNQESQNEVLGLQEDGKLKS